MRKARVPGVSVFFAILALAFAVYTLMAFQLEWETQAGRIGGGFFPRIIGAVAFVLCAGIALWTLRMGGERGDVDEAPTHLLLTTAVVCTGIAFVVLLVPAGALIATAVFVFAALWILDRGHLVRNGVIAVSTGVGLYLLLEVALRVGLPKGPLGLL